MATEENDEQTRIADETARVGQMEAQRTEDVSPFVIIPEEYKLESLEEYQQTPDRHKGRVVVEDLQSFIAYCTRHADHRAAVYASRANSTVIAVFNDHVPDTPGWRDFRCEYKAPHSTEWRTWFNKSGSKQTQTEFAQFIEDNLPDITRPTGADMLEMARSFEAKKQVNFKSDIRQQNGTVQLLYEEDMSGSAAKGTMQIPETFDLGITVYEGGTIYLVPARLRYRLHEGKLSLWYELIRPHKIVEDAFAGILNEIASKTTMPIFRGNP